ncbi:MAG: biopolymer transporter ExbD [Bacteroidia bacterium]|nr:biopolymer transporter ExbD [Bacteroidia bacterium]
MRKSQKFILPDLTGLADIAWLLIVYFLFIGQQSGHVVVPVDLPTSSYERHTHSYRASLVFWVEKNGRTWVDLSATNPKGTKWVELGEFLNNPPATLRDFRFVIVADQNAQYSAIQQLFQVFAAYGIQRISLVTNLETDPAASI